MQKYNMSWNICEENLNIFSTNFQCYKSVIKYFLNNSKNVEHNYFRYNYNKHYEKILSKTNCKLKRYRICDLEIKNTEKIKF